MTDQRPTQNHGRPRLARTKKRRNEDPKIIGQWKIGKTIGKGSSGRVKVARHVKTNQYAAIKIVSKKALVSSRVSMSDGPAHSEKALLGIEREIVIMKLIDHPNVLNLYDVWETSNELYLVMEYVEGGELFDYLVSRGRLSAEEALHYFQQIISGVSYCHSFNIAHRDLKPENLLLSKSNSGPRVKVADFGMATYDDPAAMLATSCGSPHYASPEVVEGRAYKGSISDIWSCGVILYALLAGRLPFDDDNLRILLEKVKMARYDMPSDIPAPAQDLLVRMLEKDVTRRITMAQILRHPFFLATAPPPLLLIDAQTPTLVQLSSSIDKPVQSEDEIDADIFDNLRTLWHGAPAKDIIERLLNEEKTWEKAVYHLLLKYRSKHLENFKMDEDNEGLKKHPARQSNVAQEPSPSNIHKVGVLPLEDKSERTKEVLAKSGRVDVPKVPTSAYISRPSAPTPRRSGWDGVMTLEDDLDHELPTSTPPHTRTTTSAALPQLTPIRPISPDTDMFTTTPRRGQKIISPRPQPLPLPTFSVVDEPARPVPSLHKTSQTAPDKTPVDSDILLRIPSATAPPTTGLPVIDILDLQDVNETMQRFFYQIVERLNTVQMGQVHSSAASSHSANPGSGIIQNSYGAFKWKTGDAIESTGQRVYPEVPAPPTTPALATEKFSPEDSRFEDATEGVGNLSPHPVDPTVFGLEISDTRVQFLATRPAPSSVRSESQLPRPLPSLGHAHTYTAHGIVEDVTVVKKSLWAGNKENVSVRKSENQSNAVVHKKSSLRNAQGMRKAFGERHVQIMLPLDDTDEITVKKKSIPSTRSTEASPALSDESFFLPNGSRPRRSWLGSLFNFKPASYNLLSVHDAYTTREECVRLLGALGVSILANSEATGVLKCKLEEVKDPAGVIAVAKAVRFRVELHTVTHAHSVAGYLTLLTMAQENGALSSFKLVYNRLRREWAFDIPSTRSPSSVYGPLISPGLAQGRFPASPYLR